MRELKASEMKKRGCEDCTYSRIKRKWQQTLYYCVHENEECPFHELDKYKKHRDYLKSCDKK